MGLSERTRRSRWEAKANQSDGCWLWTGYRTASGYGMFRWDTSQRITAHRAGFLLHGGVIPDGFEIDHLCRTRLCVRPDHLEPVPVAENRRRRDHAKGAGTINGRKTVCRYGHPFEGDNVLVTKAHGRNARVCRTCSRERMRAWRAARRVQ